MSMMDEATSATDATGSAGPDDVPRAEPSAEPSSAAAAKPGVEAVAAFSRAKTAERLEQRLRVEKHARLKTSYRQSKPSGAVEHAYFQTCVQVRLLLRHSWEKVEKREALNAASAGGGGSAPLW